MTKDIKQRGFTIIEVALVLAVAALIFLVVFLAVPALQRNQRDDARKRDVSNVVQAVVNAVANVNAQLAPGTAYDSVADCKTTAGCTGKEAATGNFKALFYDYLDSMSGNIDYITVANVPTNAQTQATLINLTGGTATSGNTKGADFMKTQCPNSVTAAAGTISSSTNCTENTKTTSPAINRIVVYTGAKCIGNTGVEISSARSAAIVVQVENGGNGKFYCSSAN